MYRADFKMENFIFGFTKISGFKKNTSPNTRKYIFGLVYKEDASDKIFSM